MHNYTSCLCHNTELLNTILRHYLVMVSLWCFVIMACILIFNYKTGSSPQFMWIKNDQSANYCAHGSPRTHTYLYHGKMECVTAIILHSLYMAVLLSHLDLTWFSVTQYWKGNSRMTLVSMVTNCTCLLCLTD